MMRAAKQGLSPKLQVQKTTSKTGKELEFPCLEGLHSQRNHMSSVFCVFLCPSVKCETINGCLQNIACTGGFVASPHLAVERWDSDATGLLSRYGASSSLTPIICLPPNSPLPWQPVQGGRLAGMGKPGHSEATDPTSPEVSFS